MYDNEAFVTEADALNSRKAKSDAETTATMTLRDDEN
jgi:hypothetical protein